MLKLNNISLVFIFLLFAGQAFAQYPSEKSILNVAEKSMASKNYYDALSKYKELLEFDAGNLKYLYNAAEAARLHGAFNMSKGYYEKVLKHPDNNSYPLTSFWLGNVLQLMGDYSNAKILYTVYTTEHNGEDQFYSSIANKEITACDWAIRQMSEQNKAIKIKKLGDNINTEYSEFAATGSEDSIFFSSNRFINTFNKEIPQRTLSNFLESKSNTNAVILSQTILNFPGKNIANASFSNDRSKVIFTVCEDINDFDKKCKLYLAKLDPNSKWNDTLLLPQHINMEGFTQTQPCIAIDTESGNEILYFVSDRPGGKGMLDIWYSVINEQGSFSEPVNLTDINTPFDDVTPFFYPKERMLYFGSRGYLGFGGFDLYASKLNNNKWATPLNLGMPINSSYDDIYFYKGNDEKALISSNRLESKLIDDVNNACCLDIFQISIPLCDVKLKTLVFDEITKLDLIGASIHLIELGFPNNPAKILTNDSTNIFMVPLDCNKEYKIIVTKPSYSTDSVTFLSGNPGELKEITKKIYLRPEIKLDVFSFDNQTKLALTGVQIKLLDLDTDSIYSITKLDTNWNRFETIVRSHRYKIVATKNKYAETLLEFTVDPKAVGIISKNIYLDKFLYSLLPLTLYFDNDKPRPVDKPTFTNLTYSQTFRGYFAKMDLFKSKYAKLFPTAEQTDRSHEMHDFFMYEIKGGKDTLDLFLEKLNIELSEGRKYTIFIKGFASPLAPSEYNRQLGQRRIQSLRNEFAKYKNGLFVKYLNSGLLEIREKTFGEDTAPVNVASEPKDPRSIFYINASRERRVEIVEIKE